MKVTECLNTEHGVFLTQLGILENLLQQDTPVDILRAVMLSIAASVERHRDVEEKLLYPAITQAYGENFPPIAVMESEHKIIEDCIHGIATKSKNAPDLVRQFIDTLRMHIGKEIEVLFPLAEEKIPVRELESMAAQCAERHQTQGGPRTSHGGCCSSCN